jgi:hypothetical protein
MEIEMHYDLLKLFGSALGFIICWKLIFLIFSPSELSVMILVVALLISAYGIHFIEWPEDSSFSILGLSIYRSRKIKGQYRILGIIPISSTITTKTHISILEELGPYVVYPVAKIAISTLPFGGLIGHRRDD